MPEQVVTAHIKMVPCCSEQHKEAVDSRKQQQVKWGMIRVLRDTIKSSNLVRMTLEWQCGLIETFFPEDYYTEE